LDLDLIGNTILASIAPNLKTQTAMEGRRKTSNAKEYKVGPKLLLGLFHSLEVMPLPEKGVKNVVRNATKKSPLNTLATIVGVLSSYGIQGL
jgi:hypothetical protein